MNVRKFLEDSTGMPIIYNERTGLATTPGNLNYLDTTKVKYNDPRKLAEAMYRAGFANVVAYAYYGEIRDNYANNAQFNLKIPAIDVTQLSVAYAILGIDATIEEIDRGAKIVVRSLHPVVYDNCIFASKALSLVGIRSESWIDRCAQFIKKYPKYLASRFRIDAEEQPAVDNKRVVPEPPSAGQSDGTECAKLQEALDKCVSELYDLKDIAEQRANTITELRATINAAAQAKEKKREDRSAAVAAAAKLFCGKRALSSRAEIYAAAQAHYAAKIAAFADLISAEVARAPMTVSDDLVCAVCYERVRVMLADSCLHLSVCEECAPKMGGKCPICRADTTFKQIFIAC